MKIFYNTNLILLLGFIMILGISGCQKESSEPNLSPEVEDQTFSIDENSEAGSTVGFVIASDPNLGDVLSYFLPTQTPVRAFDIDRYSGELVVSNGAVLSYEEYEVFTLIVQVADGKMATNATLTVNINDLPEIFEITLKSGAELGKDAILHSSLSDINYGTHPQLNALAWTADGTPMVMRGLIQFDFSAIPESVAIEQANLSLYHLEAWNNSGHSQLSGSNESVLQKVTEAWDETTVTWDSQPAITSDGEVTLPASTSEDQNYTEIDVISLVAGANKKLLDNYGFMLSLKTESYYRSLVFASSDADDSELHPQLHIQYVD